MTSAESTQWEYFLAGEPLDDDHRGQGLIRLPAGGPVSLAESVGPSGEWQLTDTLWKNRYEGRDEPVHPINVRDAEALLLRWVSTGRLARYPSAGSNIPPQQAERLTQADHEARAVWNRVQAPPGATEISF
ncbi:hypothetical protein [uncultured Jatrophihabitans sp.]|uniref:hypothetical protein n=1 Tax=uncultured Jatrophihabitans sp. TaxID=1610747 RepID=UPI0035CAB3ED